MTNTRPPAPSAHPTRAAHGFQRLIAGMAMTLTWACGAVAGPATAPTPSPAPLGDFEARADVGRVEKPGSAAFDAPAGRYRVTGSGENLWKTQDAFHFYRKVSGDVTFSAEVRLGEGVSNHRKAGLMLRQGLEADAPYVDVMVHGDGLIALQYRTERGGVTAGTASTIKAPAVVRLERRGDTFTLLVAPASEKEPKADPAGKPDPADRVKAAASVTLAMNDPVYAGLAVCSHDPASSVTADFSAVALKEEPK